MLEMSSLTHLEIQNFSFLFSIDLFCVKLTSIQKYILKILYGMARRSKLISTLESLRLMSRAIQQRPLLAMQNLDPEVA